METFVISTKANKFLVLCKATRCSGVVGWFLLQKLLGRDGEKIQAGYILNTKKCWPLSQDASKRCSKFWALMHEAQSWGLLTHFNGILTLGLKASPYLLVCPHEINKKSTTYSYWISYRKTLIRIPRTFQVLLKSYKAAGNLTWKHQWFLQSNSLRTSSQRKIL